LTRRTTVAFCLLAIAALASPLAAQQTIFNVPSPDVLEGGKVYLELDASLRPYEPRFSSFVPRVVVGLGHHIEGGFNLTGNIQPAPDLTTLVPTLKWKFYDNPQTGWSFVAGDDVFFPLRQGSYDIGNYAYVELIRTFKNGLRVGLGGYDFTADVVAPNANRAGGQFTFELPITSRATFAADWFTGKHQSGFLSVGPIFKPNPKLTLYTSYSIGNSDVTRGNHFFLIEIGYNIN